MTEKRYKLTKDGKCVGYMRIADGYISYRSVTGKNWLARCVFEWDAIHDLVCQDRRGKDVYEGDKVRWWEHGYERDSFNGTVKWSALYAGWALVSEETCSQFRMAPQDRVWEIELIEEGASKP